MSNNKSNLHFTGRTYIQQWKRDFDAIETHTRSSDAIKIEIDGRLDSCNVPLKENVQKTLVQVMYYKIEIDGHLDHQVIATRHYWE